MEEQCLYLKKWDSKTYFDIVTQLGLSVAMDYMSSSYMNRLLDKKPQINLQKFINKYSGKNFLVLGAGPSLESDIKKLMDSSLLDSLAIVAADGASYALKSIAGIRPDFVVTDLDGFPDDEVIMANEGTVAVVHAHGDNIEAITRYVPKLNSLIGSTQCEPSGRLYNFGGFTDGDRALFFLINLNPGMIILAGMDFGDTVGYYSNTQNKNLSRKARKLAIGKRLVESFAAKCQTTKLYNMTSLGSPIAGFKKIAIEDINKMIKGR